MIRVLLLLALLLPQLVWANDYYTHGSFPSPNSPATSASMRAELDLISGGFDKLPGIIGNNGKAVIVNAGGTGLNTTAGTLSLDGNLSFSGAFATTLALPGVSGTLATLGGNETFSAKSINLASNTLTGTTAQFNAALSDNDFATLAGGESLSNKTLVASILSGTFTGTYTLAGTGTLTSPTITSPAITSAILTTSTVAADPTGSLGIASKQYVDALWTTGDVKLTIKTTADSGWVMMNDGTIGDGSSGATTRANADTSSLFTLMWNNCADANCAVSGGRGASAAVDFAAHKTITLPKSLGRAIAISGTGSGLTARALGAVTGAEDAIVVAHTHTITDPTHQHSFARSQQGGGGGSGTSGDAAGGATGNGLTIAASTGITGTNSTGSSGTGANMQPTVFLNIMVKL